MQLERTIVSYLSAVLENLQIKSLNVTLKYGLVALVAEVYAVVRTVGIVTYW